jgi:general secretion pathway protein J
MTLIEVMVALVLLAMLSVGMLSALRVGQQAYDRVVRMGTANDDTLAAQRFLRTTLESTNPFLGTSGSGQPAFGLEGGVEHIAFSAPMPQAAGGAGLYRYDIRLVAGSGSDLVVSASLDRNGEASPSRHEEVLVRRVRAMELAYFDARSARWMDSWAGQRKPPALVRLRLKFPANDSRQWPELIAAPRVTDDGNCQFDTVSQACRSGTP